MRILVLGKDHSFGSTRFRRLRELVPKALDAMRCSHVMVYDRGIAAEASKDWARANQKGTTCFAKFGDFAGGKKKPLNVVAWEIAFGGKPDLVLGFWPSEQQQELLELLKGHGVRCVVSGAPDKEWAPL